MDSSSAIASGPSGKRLRLEQNVLVASDATKSEVPNAASENMQNMSTAKVAFQVSTIGSGLLGVITMACEDTVATLREKVELSSSILVSEQRLVIGPVLVGADCPRTIGELLQLPGLEGVVSSAEIKRGEDMLLGVSLTVVRDTRQLVLGGTSKGPLFLWDLDCQDPVLELPGHRDWVCCATVNWELRKAVTGSRDWTLRFWDVATGSMLQEMQGHRGPVMHIAVDWCSQRALSGSRDRSLRWWDLSTGLSLHELSGHAGLVTCLTLEVKGENDQRGMSGSRDRTLRLWNLTNGHAVHVFRGHVVPVTSLSVDWQRNRALSASGSDCMRLWDLQHGTQLHELRVNHGFVTSLSVDWCSSRALSSGGACLLLWDLEKGKPVHDLGTKVGPVTCITVDWVSRRALSGGERCLCMWNLNSDSGPVMEFLGHKGSVVCVTADWAAQRAIAGSEELPNQGVLRLWDLSNGQLLASLSDLPAVPRFLVLRWNRRFVLSCGMACAPTVWHFEEALDGVLSLSKKLECPAGWVSCVVPSWN